MLNWVPLELQPLAVMLSVRFDVLRERRKQDLTAWEAGLTTVEWIILIGIVAAMAMGAGKLVADKVNKKAADIPGL